MTKLNFLKQQVIETRNFTTRLMAEMPNELWFTIPENTNSNFAWQVGHIFLAQNYHIISCAFGPNEKLMEKISLHDYAKVFGGLGSPNRSVSSDFVSIDTLKAHFQFVYDQCLELLTTVDDEFLSQQLEPTLFKNPIAETKYEAISWSFKHEMWHCAEMEQIKIAFQKPFKWIVR